MELKTAARTWPIICLVLLFASSPLVTAIKCYVCGPASKDAFPSSSPSTVTEIRPCDEFDSAENRAPFERDCAEEFHGCITQIEGNNVSRSCESLKISSCGALTNAAYCLCDSDLCNSGPIQPPEPSSDSPRHDDLPYGDDEDYINREGSGNSSLEYVDSAEKSLCDSETSTMVSKSTPKYIEVSTETEDDTHMNKDFGFENNENKNMPGSQTTVRPNIVQFVIIFSLLITKLCF